MPKGNLEPVRGSRLPVKVGKDINQEEICQLAIKKHCDHDQFFSNLEQYVLLYPDKKLVYQVPGTNEMFTLAKYKTEFGKPFAKLTLSLCKKKRLSVKFIHRIGYCGTYSYFQHFFQAKIISF